MERNELLLFRLIALFLQKKYHINFFVFFYYSTFLNIYQLLSINETMLLVFEIMSQIKIVIIIISAISLYGGSYIYNSFNYYFECFVCIY